MRKLLMVAALALVPVVSQAQFVVGARLGYGSGLGDVAGNGATTLAMSDWVKSQIPLQLDALYKVTPEVAVGAYFSYGFAQTGIAECDLSGADCSAKDTRVGVQAVYTFNNSSPTLVPWLGVNVGYEWNTISTGGVDATFKGMEWLGLQAGGDFKVNEQFSVGPYVQLSLGQYSSGEVAGTSGDVVDTTAHQWLGFGVRGKFDL
jgi:autotransporter-like protein